MIVTRSSLSASMLCSPKKSKKKAVFSDLMGTPLKIPTRIKNKIKKHKKGRRDDAFFQL